MEDGININVEIKCSTCVYGPHDEDQEPCRKCFESDIRFSQWKFDPDVVIKLEN
jgi:hypothetical protein